MTEIKINNLEDNTSEEINGEKVTATKSQFDCIEFYSQLSNQSLRDYFIKILDEHQYNLNQIKQRTN